MINNSRPLLSALVIVSLLPTVASVFARTQPIATIPSLVLAVGSPYLPLSALAGLLVAVSCRRILLSMLAAGVVGGPASQFRFRGTTSDNRLLSAPTKKTFGCSRRIFATDKQIQAS